MLPTALLGLLLALLMWGGYVGLAISAIWLIGGLYMVANSRSRGLYADLIFMLTWPIHLVLER